MSKVTIITQHLLNNYGGLLQNFAIQRILKKLGHESITIDYMRTIAPKSFKQYLISWMKSFLCLFIPWKKRPFERHNYRGERLYWSNEFVSKWIKIKYRCYRYNAKMLDGSDIVIVGSDQVWRPKYNYRIEDMFLKFAEKKSIKRIAYAASFGVDEWEYTPRQTKICAGLAKKFHAISVREESGVMLCKEKLGVEATWVLDPTLLLDKEDYCEVCKDIPVVREKILVAYVLDNNKDIRLLCESIAAERRLTLKFFGAGTDTNFTVPEWLAMFRDASYIVTDSFHGTVFSIIFGKDFKCLYNKSRGSARFDSLLKLYESGKLEMMREFSLNWLRNALKE